MGMIRRIDLRGRRNIYESYKAVRRLFESDTRIKRTERIIEDNFRGILDLNGKVAGPDYYVNNNPETVWKEYLMFNLRHTFNLMANSDVSYLPGVASIAYRDCDFDKLNQDPEKIGKLVKYIRLAKKVGKLITPDMNLDELTELYEPALKQEEKSEDEKRMSLSLTRNKRYEIIQIDDFETAKRYGKLTGIGNGEGELCYTEKINIWDSFTKNGRNYCYLCLRDDYKAIEPVKSEGYPKDDYGLSMIWVFVNPDGDISNSNVRWNHGDKTFSDVDNMFTRLELEELLGVRFEDVFRPNTEVVERFKKKVEDVKRRLANGESPEELFDDIYDFSEGYASARLGAKWNFIGRDGKILSDRWFDCIYNFSEGYAGVCLNNRWNFIGRDGKLLLDQQFDYVCNFSGGYARVCLNDRWNFIGRDGKILSEQWFDDNYNFSEGYASVRLGVKWNFIGSDGKILSEQWFNDTYNFSEGYASVRLGVKWNFIGGDGKMLSEQWFDCIYNFSEGYARVQLGTKWNFIDSTGKILSERWFDDVYPFINGVATVRLNGKCYYIDKEGRLSK